MSQTISIAMATWNGSAHIREQILSIISQTRQPDEIIIVDDCSTDNTVEILETILEDFCGRWEIIRKTENTGYIASFFEAFSACSGDIIAFSDQDDVWHPKKIERASIAFQDSPQAILVSHDFEVFTKRDGVTIPSYRQYLNLNAKPDYFLMKGCAIMINAKNLFRFFNSLDRLGWAHDAFFTFLAIAADKAVVVNEVLMSHRIHENNTSGRISKQAGFIEKLILTRLTRRSSNHFRTVSFVSQLYGSRLSSSEANLRLLKLHGWDVSDAQDVVRHRIEFLMKIDGMKNLQKHVKGLRLAKMFIFGEFKYGNGLIGFLRCIGIRPFEKQ